MSNLTRNQLRRHRAERAAIVWMAVAAALVVVAGAGALLYTTGVRITEALLAVQPFGVR